MLKIELIILSTTLIGLSFSAITPLEMKIDQINENFGGTKEDYYKNNFRGNYRFSFANPNTINQDQFGFPDGTKFGYYSFIDEGGRVYITCYTALKGFRAKSIVTDSLPENLQTFCMDQFKFVMPTLEDEPSDHSPVTYKGSLVSETLTVKAKESSGRVDPTKTAEAGITATKINTPGISASHGDNAITVSSDLVGSDSSPIDSITKSGITTSIDKSKPSVLVKGVKTKPLGKTDVNIQPSRSGKSSDHGENDLESGKDIPNKVIGNDLSPDKGLSDVSENSKGTGNKFNSKQPEEVDVSKSSTSLNGIKNYIDQQAGKDASKSNNSLNGIKKDKEQPAEKDVSTSSNSLNGIKKDKDQPAENDVSTSSNSLNGIKKDVEQSAGKDVSKPNNSLHGIKNDITADVKKPEISDKTPEVEAQGQHSENKGSSSVSTKLNIKSDKPGSGKLSNVEKQISSTESSIPNTSDKVQANVIGALSKDTQGNSSDNKDLPIAPKSENLKDNKPGKKNQPKDEITPDQSSIPIKKDKDHPSIIETVPGVVESQNQLPGVDISVAGTIPETKVPSKDKTSFTQSSTSKHDTISPPNLNKPSNIGTDSKLDQNDSGVPGRPLTSSVTKPNSEGPSTSEENNKISSGLPNQPPLHDKNGPSLGNTATKAPPLIHRPQTSGHQDFSSNTSPEQPAISTASSNNSEKPVLSTDKNQAKQPGSIAPENRKPEIGGRFSNEEETDKYQNDIPVIEEPITKSVIKTSNTGIKSPNAKKIDSTPSIGKQSSVNGKLRPSNTNESLKEISEVKTSDPSKSTVDSPISLNKIENGKSKTSDEAEYIPPFKPLKISENEKIIKTLTKPLTIADDIKNISPHFEVSASFNPESPNVVSNGKGASLTDHNKPNSPFTKDKSLNNKENVINSKPDQSSNTENIPDLSPSSPSFGIKEDSQVKPSGTKPLKTSKVSNNINVSPTAHAARGGADALCSPTVTITETVTIQPTAVLQSFVSLPTDLPITSGTCRARIILQDKQNGLKLLKPIKNDMNAIKDQAKSYKCDDISFVV